MQRSFRVPKLDIPNRAGHEQLASLHSGVSAAVHAVSSQHRNADTTPADDASPVVADHHRPRGRPSHPEIIPLDQLRRREADGCAHTETDTRSDGPSSETAPDTADLDDEDGGYCEDMPNTSPIPAASPRQPGPATAEPATTSTVSPRATDLAPRRSGGDATLPGNYLMQDIQMLGVVGRGSGGAVHRVLHVPSARILAMKVIPLDANEKQQRQLMVELRSLYEAKCRYIVKYYGAFFRESSVAILMEYMNAGSLADVVNTNRTGLPETLLSAIALQVLEGLHYLHKERHVIHRDIKPGNVLINRKGEVKITDFGVSGQLASTISSCASWLGTVTYMSPERILGKSYSVASDIWSFGLTMHELAIGRFPYKLDSTAKSQDAGFWVLLDRIVDHDPPELSPETFSPEFRDFHRLCMRKAPADRPSAAQLLEHPFVSAHQSDQQNVALAHFIVESIAKKTKRNRR